MKRNIFLLFSFVFISLSLYGMKTGKIIWLNGISTRIKKEVAQDLMMRLNNNPNNWQYFNLEGTYDFDIVNGEIIKITKYETRYKKILKLSQAGINVVFEGELDKQEINPFLSFLVSKNAPVIKVNIQHRESEKSYCEYDFTGKICDKKLINQIILILNKN